MTSEIGFGWWVAAWVAFAVFLLARHSRRRDGAGLLVAFVLSFGVQYWLAAAIYVLPWYDHGEVGLTGLGLRQVVFAIAALAVGAEIGSRLPWLGRGYADPSICHEVPAVIAPHVVRFYLIMGCLLHAVLPAARSVPSATALALAGSSLVVAAGGLACRNAWDRGRPPYFWLLMAASLMLPVFTVVMYGFLGYGFGATLTIFAFVSSFYRPRWKELALGIVVAYAGISLYVTYMRDRGDIRNVVWSGAALSDRLERVADAAASFEWFDPWNIDHLDRVEGRLNQSFLVGAAVHYLDSGGIEYARGATLWDAVLAVAPRAIWRDKTFVAGGSELVTKYTGLEFTDDTSVNVGPVMELYVNFGTPGVLAGFFLFGAILVLVDGIAWMRLRRGDGTGFLVWYLPALPLLQLGSFAEGTSTVGAAWIVALSINWTMVRLWGPGRRAAGALVPIAPAQEVVR